MKTTTAIVPRETIAAVKLLLTKFANLFEEGVVTRF
jgi:hypothetical protein